jgi:hypothetical protein
MYVCVLARAVTLNTFAMDEECSAAIHRIVLISRKDMVAITEEAGLTQSRLSARQCGYMTQFSREQNSARCSTCRIWPMIRDHAEQGS